MRKGEIAENTFLRALFHKRDFNFIFETRYEISCDCVCLLFTSCLRFHVMEKFPGDTRRKWTAHAGQISLTEV